MHTYRHDQAARQIIKAILRSHKSGFVVMMDIGNQQHCALVCPPTSHIDIASQPMSSRPASLHMSAHCSQTTLDRTKFTSLSPQSFLTALLQNISSSNSSIAVTRTNGPQNQYDRAISQHRPLADAIRQAAPHARVTYLPLLLGVAGTIYSSTTSHLRYLGVRKQALPRLLNCLHVMAIANLHWIKRHKERHLDPQAWRHTHPPR